MEKHTCFVCGKEHDKQHEKDYFCSQECSDNWDRINDKSTLYEDNIICPYCGSVIDPEGEYDMSWDDEYELKCPDCEKPFTMETHHSVTYSTTPLLEELDDDTYMEEENE